MAHALRRIHRAMCKKVWSSYELLLALAALFAGTWVKAIF